nr:proline-rich protein 23E [Nyctereutes procyonoides]
MGPVFVYQYQGATWRGRWESAQEGNAWLSGFGGRFSSEIGASASTEPARQSVHPASQIPEEAHVTPAVATPWAPVHSAYGAQPAIDPTLWPVMGTPCAVHPCMGYPAPWSYPWVPIGSPLWLGHPPPAAPAPSVWPWGFSSFDPQVRSQHLATMAPRGFPCPRGPPPPCSSVPLALSRDASGYSPQVGWQAPASSAFPAAVERPSRGASHLKRCQAPPSEWASRFSIWAPAPPSSPELCPLPPSPSTDSPPEPCCPHCPRPPCRACRCLF